MGGGLIGGAVGGPLGATVGAIGPGKISKALGLAGEQGEYYQPSPYDMTAVNRLQSEAAAEQSPQMDSALRAYSKGGRSFESLFGTGAEQRAAVLNPTAGSQYATEQVMQSPLLGQLYGKGGTLERTGQEEQQLASRGFSLQPEDYEAYGQSSGQLARLFGGAEQDLAGSLAARGLAGGGSGAAAQGYAGLQGTRNEQLAGLQRQIADQRMNMNLQRLGQTRNFLSGLGQQAGQEVQNQYGRNLSGVQASRQALGSAADAYNQAYGTQEQGNMASMQSKIGQKSPTIGESLGMGLHSSAAKIGTIPGNAASAYAGGGTQAASKSSFGS